MISQDRTSAVAVAHPNIAFIKYWGNRDDSLHLPSTGSISMTLDRLFTITRLELDTRLDHDQLMLNHQPAPEPSRLRVQQFLDIFRKKCNTPIYCKVESINNFPTASGIASSASAFAALTVAASHVYSLNLSMTELSTIARRGSGSACRSISGGFVEWYPGEDDVTSYAETIAPPRHWQLSDCIAVVSNRPKTISSQQGHRSAHTSPLQQVRISTAPERLKRCRAAILNRDFEALAEVVELDSNIMHAVMMTSHPPLLYWAPETLFLMQNIIEWRREGMQVCYTIDAGANVHVICPSEQEEQVCRLLKSLPPVIQVIAAPVGGSARLVEPTESANLFDFPKGHHLLP
ncbi:MAG: diphosphomevalonate decarboxylase [Chloroflexota bacterium]